MLEISELYKVKGDIVINNITFKVAKGNLINIECSDQISDLLIDLILDKEVPTKGKIYIHGEGNKTYIRKNMKHIGVVFRKEGFYENMTVKFYMKFYKNITNSKVNYKEIMVKLALIDIENTKINKLTYSQKRRLSFARELLKEPKFLIFQEPILNMDRYDAKLIIQSMDQLISGGAIVVNTSVSFKDILLLGGKSYSIDENGLKEIQGEENSKEESDSGDETVYKIEKIPAKIDERMILFDPMEIDYVESEQGVSNLNIKGEKFPCMLPLTELEKRLKHFGFFRCHRSYLVNLQRVREVVMWTRNSYSLSLDDKTKSSIPLSKGRMKELKDILNI
ncbi:LytTR family transcriptional regulator DNA-binding domain-containing protein [Clostridium coskatii]|uniref:Transcriptional regulatory protein YpdB n=1 Tax=Clostridium coskatii TaxID=1705578 RepID=A0A166TN79_9CLOT|nr:LytTR family transcriptional regulator DNA-binding domain-containing protein [Clostridium coskatii]OAA93890.1 Transcriptional regulatory protein YpdB [Clostridium coskatii]OBR95219.1 transcriptional regulatory protein YpdB [Clostridium coskatii]